MNKILVCKKLRELTGLPLNLCMQAYLEAGENIEDCLSWIKERAGSLNFQPRETYYRSFAVETEDLVYFGQVGGSDTLIRTSEVTNAIDSFESEDDFKGKLQNISLAAKESLTLSNLFSLPKENLTYYLHLRLSSNSCVGGIVAWYNSGNQIKGEEIHWAFNLNGQEGRFVRLKGQSAKEEIINKMSIDNSRGNVKIISSIREIYLLK